MFSLNNLKDSKNKKRSNVQRVGRGPGSQRGKTSCRGQKGAGSRSGYKRRYGYEGGQMRLFSKLPHKGFTRGRFLKTHVILNLKDIDRIYKDGETVNLSSLYEKGCISKKISGGLRILGDGDIVSKKVTIEAHFFSKKAKSKLDDKKIIYKVIER